MDDEFVEESTDQPQNEESENDQPDTEDSSEGSELSEDEDQPGEESSEDTIEIDGQYYTIDEVKKGFMRQKDYTQKTQSLSEQRREMDEMKHKLNNIESKRELTAEEQQVQDFIQKYGIVTNDKLDHQARLQQAKMEDEREFQEWRASINASDKVAGIVRTLGTKYTQMSYSQIYNEFVKDISAPRKVIKRKKIGVTSKNSAKKSGSMVYTREKIKELIAKGEYEKHRPKIMAELEGKK